MSTLTKNVASPLTSLSRACALAALLFSPPVFGESLQKGGSLGGNLTTGISVNNTGQVVGQSIIAGVSRAFLYSSGKVQDLGILTGYSHSVVGGVSESGHIAGTSSSGFNLPSQAFLYTKGQLIGLGSFGGTRSNAYGINNAGQVVGQSSFPGDGVFHAFLYSHGRMNDLGTLGGTVSSASAINNSGRVVGQSSIAGDAQFHAFLYSNGQMLDLGTLGGSLSYATAINNTGDVVGFSSTNTSHIHAFRYANGQLIDLGTLPGVTDTSAAYGINNSGQIVGETRNASDVLPRAFLYSGGVMRDLNILYASLLGDGISVGFTYLYNAQSISDNGLIVGSGVYFDGAKTSLEAYVLDTRKHSPSKPGK